MTALNNSADTELDFHIYAGREALAHIKQQGLKNEDVSMLLGASSGPKWLVLHGFDQFLLTAMKQRQQPLDLLGTSAGAWRMACYAQQDSLAAHQRLTDAYIEQSYSAKPSGDEILSSCRNMVNKMLGPQGAEEILKHPSSRLHLITTQCHGLAAKQSRLWQGLGFVVAALGNLISRKSLGLHFTRIVMHHPAQKPPLERLRDLPSRYQVMERPLVEDTILSTGCIPVLTKGVRDIAGKGIYQDGGITDYGFDLPLNPKQGFVLYPHFSQIPAPSWFDKSLKWRKPKRDHYSRAILLVPKQTFVKSLPFEKIPDRNDFVELNNDERKAYWNEVVQRSQIFTQQLEELQPEDWAKHVEPLPW
jgi:hypothetical protein